MLQIYNNNKSLVFLNGHWFIGDLIEELEQINLISILKYGLKNYKIPILSVIILLIAITIGCKKVIPLNSTPAKGDTVNIPNFASMY